MYQFNKLLIAKMKFHLLKDSVSSFTPKFKITNNQQQQSYTRVAEVSLIKMSFLTNVNVCDAEKEFGHRLENYMSANKFCVNFTIIDDALDRRNQLRVKVEDTSLSGVLDHILNDELAKMIRVKLKCKNLYGKSEKAFINFSTPYMKVRGTGALSKCFSETVVPAPASFFNTWKNQGSFTGELTITVSIREQFNASFPLAHSTPISARDNKKVEPYKDKLQINKKIFFEQIATDVVMISGDGSSLMCHKHFLAAHSLEFEKKFKADGEESKISIVTMPNLKVDSMNAFLAYLYFWDTSKAEEDSMVAVELFTAAYKYQISSLEWKMIQLLKNKYEDCEWYSINAALHLFFFARSTLKDDDMLKMAAKVLKSKDSKEIHHSSVFQNLFKHDHGAAMDLCVMMCTL